MSDTTQFPPCRHHSGAEPGRCLVGRQAPRDCVCAAYSEDLVAALGLDPAGRTRCEIWTRVMGYHRPTSAFNAGKAQEHADRRMFAEHG